MASFILVSELGIDVVRESVESVESVHSLENLYS